MIAPWRLLERAHDSAMTDLTDTHVCQDLVCVRTQSGERTGLVGQESVGGLEESRSNHAH